MTDGEKAVQWIEALPSEKARKMAYRIMMALIKGSDSDREEIYAMAQSGAGFESIIPIIERIEAG